MDAKCPHQAAGRGRLGGLRPGGLRHSQASLEHDKKGGYGKDTVRDSMVSRPNTLPRPCGLSRLLSLGFFGYTAGLERHDWWLMAASLLSFTLIEYAAVLILRIVVKSILQPLNPLHWAAQAQAPGLGLA